MMQDHAYRSSEGRVLDGASLLRSIGTLRRIPFVLIEEERASYLLLAYTLTETKERCGILYATFEPFIAVGSNRQGGTAANAASKVHGNATLRAEFDAANALDLELYEAAWGVWCEHWRAALLAPKRESCVAEIGPSIYGPEHHAPEPCWPTVPRLWTPPVDI